MPARLPIILAHGICPFNRVLHPLRGRDNTGDDRFHYFRLIRSTLIRNGYAAFHSRVGWASSMEARARDLRRELLRLTEGFTRWPRVHIIAHSMGGMDARMMLFRFRMEERVASLTTIGTPHLGTPYADWGVGRLGWLVPRAGKLGPDLSGILDLTTESCVRFNRAASAYEEQNGVVYRTVAGVQPLERVFLPLKFSYRIISRSEGENDGLVPLSSALWQERYHLRTIDADHLNQIGWWDRGELRAGLDRETFEAGIRRIYLDIAAVLED